MLNWALSWTAENKTWRRVLTNRYFNFDFPNVIESKFSLLLVSYAAARRYFSRKLNKIDKLPVWHTGRNFSLPGDRQITNLLPRAMPVRGLGWHWLWENRQPEPLNLGVPVVCRHALLINVKPITSQEKFYFPRANAILARAQSLLWVRDWQITGLYRLCRVSWQVHGWHASHCRLM
jgi:hypothetical protein